MFQPIFRGKHCVVETTPQQYGGRDQFPSTVRTPTPSITLVLEKELHSDDQPPIFQDLSTFRSKTLGQRSSYLIYEKHYPL